MTFCAIVGVFGKLESGRWGVVLFVAFVVVVCEIRANFLAFSMLAAFTLDGALMTNETVKQKIVVSEGVDER